MWVWLWQYLKCKSWKIDQVISTRLFAMWAVPISGAFSHHLALYCQLLATKLKASIWISRRVWPVGRSCHEGMKHGSDQACTDQMLRYCGCAVEQDFAKQGSGN